MNVLVNIGQHDCVQFNYSNKLLYSNLKKTFSLMFIILKNVLVLLLPAYLKSVRSSSRFPHYLHNFDLIRSIFSHHLEKLIDEFVTPFS